MSRVDVLGACVLVLLSVSACRASELDIEDHTYAPEAVDTTAPGQDRLAALFADYDSSLIAAAPFDSVAAFDWVEETLATLSLDQKIGQLLIVDLSAGARGVFGDPERLVRDLHVGGFLVPRLMRPREVYQRTSRLQSIAHVPLFFAADYERGVGRFNNPLTELPSNMAIGATRDTVFAAAMGRLTAIESRAIGINLIFAPVVDVNNNPENPIINIRSFGEDADMVGRMAAAYVREAQSFGVQTTLKHFPGHGDTSVDTHARMAVVERDRASLDQIELKPYATLLERGARPAGVMSAHLWVKALDDVSQPATFSGRVLTGLLREELGFEGFVVTDDIKMGALQGQYSFEDRMLKPLEAGADIILTPGEPERAVSVIRAAVASGALPDSIIDASVRRVLWAKARAGLYRGYSPNPDFLEYLLAESRGAGLARAIADRAVTLLKSSESLPLDDTHRTAIVQLTNYRGSESIGAAMDALESRQAALSQPAAFRFDGDVSAAQRSRVLEAARGADVVVVSLYLRLIAGRGDAALSQSQAALVRALLDVPVPVVLITFGNPYAVSAFANADAHVVAYDQSLETVAAVHAVLTGSLPPTGRLPITVEPYSFGAGEDEL